jgi:hypothetical protein
MLRITDLASGLSVDIKVPDLAIDALRLQLFKGSNPRNLSRFRRRLAFYFERALGDALDASIQPPLSTDAKTALFVAKRVGVPLPYECLRSRKHLLRFLRENAGRVLNMHSQEFDKPKGSALQKSK